MAEVEENPNIVVAKEESIKKKRKRKRDKKSKMVAEKESKKEKENEEKEEDDEEQENNEEKQELDDELKEEIKKEMKSGSGIMSAELFSSIEISEPTMKAIKDMGFEYMTQVNYKFFFLCFPCLYSTSGSLMALLVVY